MQSEKWKEKPETKKNKNNLKKHGKKSWRNTKFNFIFKKIVSVKHEGILRVRAKMAPQTYAKN